MNFIGSCSRCGKFWTTNEMEDEAPVDSPHKAESPDKIVGRCPDCKGAVYEVTQHDLKDMHEFSEGCCPLCGGNRELYETNLYDGYSEASFRCTECGFDYTVNHRMIDIEVNEDGNIGVIRYRQWMQEKNKPKDEEEKREGQGLNGPPDG